jgi:hypothetical protein
VAGENKGSSPPSRLAPLQVDLLQAFFAREQRLVLTGGAALAGFYFGHRETEDLDFFGRPGLDLQEISRALLAASEACGAQVEAVQTFPDFRRWLARRGEESCIVDLVIDRAPPRWAARKSRTWSISSSSSPAASTLPPASRTPRRRTLALTPAPWPGFSTRSRSHRTPGCQAGSMRRLWTRSDANW